MVKVVFIDYQNVARAVDAAEGESLKDAAIKNLVPGIDADCGGNCACATCRVDVDPEWLSKLPSVSADEKALLAIVDSVKPNSRLACQIKARPELNGITVHTPMGQH